MKKTILIGMTAVALSLGACAKKTPPPEPVTEQPVTPPARHPV